MMQIVDQFSCYSTVKRCFYQPAHSRGDLGSISPCGKSLVDRIASFLQAHRKVTTASIYLLRSLIQSTGDQITNPSRNVPVPRQEIKQTTGQDRRRLRKLPTGIEGTDENASRLYCILVGGSTIK